MTRFELATPATRTQCATKLRYIPTHYLIIKPEKLFSSIYTKLHSVIYNYKRTSPKIKPHMLLYLQNIKIIAGAQTADY